MGSALSDDDHALLGPAALALGFDIGEALCDAPDRGVDRLSSFLGHAPQWPARGIPSAGLDHHGGSVGARSLACRRSGSGVAGAQTPLGDGAPRLSFPLVPSSSQAPRAPGSLAWRSVAAGDRLD